MKRQDEVKLVVETWLPYRQFGKFSQLSLKLFVPGNSVNISTDYGLDGPGSNPGGDEVFRPSKPALGPTQPPVKWVPGISRF